MTFTLDGQPYSKANSRQIVQNGSTIRSIKSEKALNYEEYALLQLTGIVAKYKQLPFLKPVCVVMDVYYPDRRQDLDPSLILDVMQKGGVYKNDRLVEEMHLFRHVDKRFPRATIHIYEIEKAGL